jgi:hypothetical protein
MQTLKLTKMVKKSGVLIMLLVSIVSLGSQQASAFTQNDFDCTTTTTGCFYDPSAQDCGNSADVTDAQLIGGDGAQKTWNFFKSKGLSDKQVAGIMGNMMQESHFDPQIIQGGGRSKNPSDAGSGGWGLIQWTPGSKIVGMAKDAGVSGPIYSLATQLDLVWQHMHNHPVVTQQFDLNHFKSINDEVEAGSYFGSQIEGFGVAGSRLAFATSALNKYGGTSGSNSPSDISAATDSGCGNDQASSFASPECTSATGNAVILCEAKKYDPVNYVWGGGHGGGAAYHNKCPVIKARDSDCGLDCAGLVSVAVYDAFKNDKSWVTTSIVSDTANWKSISFGDLQPGDLIEPDVGHVEIVDHVSGGRIATFGAHSAGRPQPDQVSSINAYTNTSGNQYFRYIGKGAHS